MTPRSTLRTVAAVVGLLILLSRGLPRALAGSPTPEPQTADYSELLKHPRRALLKGTPPAYPYEARRKGETGAGVALVIIDRKTGLVSRVVMYTSTGYADLDRATVRALQEWRFRPDTFKVVRVPIQYEFGHGYATTGYPVTEKSESMDDALASYLGKGTVLEGPMPRYPSSVQWDFREGRGRYELYVNKAGTVDRVRVLRSSGDPYFDDKSARAMAAEQRAAHH